MKERNINLDIIRCIAVWSVLSVHFFLNNGFYEEIVVGKSMLFGSIGRTLFMICVPLFLLLTGYLMNKKVCEKKYYCGLRRTLGIYVISSVFILVFRIFYLHEQIGKSDVLMSITMFQHYSWYVGMYVGLFLMIPFLNIVYNGLHTRKEKKILLLTFLILTTIPSLVNQFDFSILPTWWTEIYPLTYYFIGAYICEYKDEIKIPLKWNLFFIILSIAFAGVYKYWRSYNSTFFWGNWGDFENVLNSTLIFLFFLRIKAENIPVQIQKIIRKISELSLSIYLVSWIGDNLVYLILNASVLSVKDRLLYYGLIVPFVFILSTMIAFLVDKIYKIIEKKVIRNIVSKCEEK